MASNKRKNLVQLMLTIIMCTSLGCIGKLNDRKSVMSYVRQERNHLNINSTSNQIDFGLTVLPWQVQAYDSGFVNLKVGKKLVANLKKKVFFMLAISRNGKEVLRQLDFNTYSEVLQVLSFRMADYIDLTGDTKDAIRPEYCLFHQTYGTTLANNVLIVFNGADLTQYEKVRIRIREFGLGTGDLDFGFRMADIDKLQSITQSN